MTDDLNLDLDEARRFLAALTGGDEAVHFQTFGDRKDEAGKADPRLARKAFLRFAQAERWLVDANRSTAGIFVTVNCTDGKGREIENVTALRALFIDCDGTAPLPSAWPLAPSIIVQRDETHWHAYWLLQQSQDLQRFEAAQVQLACHWMTDCTIADLPRVMRLPGFLHQKAAPVLVRLVHAGSERYSIDQVVAAHPVTDWEALPEKYRRKAARAGLCAMPETQPRATDRPRPAAAPADDDDAWQLEQFRKWAGHKDVSEGKANAHEGRDNAAYVIACEGAGRQLHRDDVHAVVLDYLQRARVANPDADAERIVASAFSKPRQGTRPVRQSHPARSAADPSRPRPSFTDGPTPPPAVPPPAAGGPEPEQRPWDNLDQEQIKGRWSITDNGVAPIEWDGRVGSLVVKENKRLGNLPIWPSQLGRDVATGRTYMRIGWFTPAGETRRAWLPEDDVKEGRALLALPEGPIAGGRWQQAAIWLTEARRAVTNPDGELVGHIGWCGVNGARRWVWPSGKADGPQYIGHDLPAHGELDGWKRGLSHVLGLGERGHVALVVVALSVAAPWARLLSGQRNPILGLMARSSSGKGSVIDWALAPWCDPSALTLPATSTAKGIQDRGVDVPDLPIFLDELQQLAEADQSGTALSNAMYYLGNGQQRVRATKTGGAEGGARRYGVGFYAAEAPVLIGRNEGVALRAIELTGDPCPDEATARVLRAAGGHTGVLAAEISELVRSRPVTDWARTLRERAAVIAKTFEGLRAGDSDVLALVDRGLHVLADTCDISSMPIDQVLAWLAARTSEQRKATTDREAVCLREALDLIQNLDWQLGDHKVLNQRPIAWRSTGRAKPLDDATGREDSAKAEREVETYDCDPSHPSLAPIFARAGGEDRVLRAWADRKWIQTQDRRLRVRRRSAGYVVRWTPHGMRQAGYEPKAVESGEPARAPAPAPAPAEADNEPPF